MPENKSFEARLEDCEKLSDLYDSFSLQELMSLTRDRLLEKWLKDNIYETEAAEVANKVHLSDDALILELLKILRIDISKVSDYEAQMIARALKNENEKERMRGECGIDGVIVTSQSELAETLMNEDAHKIYLYKEAFQIPLNRPKITYDGRDGAVINILAKDNLDFDGQEIYFYNLTLIFHYLKPHQVQINHSAQNHNHLVYLDDGRIAKDEYMSRAALMDFLKGRKPFELPQEYKNRAVGFSGVIVGKTILNAEDYDIRRKAFILEPVWRVDYIEEIRKYLNGDKFYFRAIPEEAEYLYTNERAQLIYADFDADGDKAIIKRLYLHSANGKGKVYTLYRLCNGSFSFTSGSGGMGYGIDLIDPDA